MHRKYIGDKAFYSRVMHVVIPIIIQNGISSFVNMLDNIMVGQVGTVQMSGVSIVNQLLFVFNLCIFGATSGAGIFTAQFYGSGDEEGVRHTFRFKYLVGILLTVLGIALFLLGGTPLIQLYLKGEGSMEDAALTLAYGQDYLRIMLIGLLPFALANAYGSNLRETNETFIPMVAGISAVFINLILNYILIFGHLGFAPMGVLGAAVATNISRFAELGIMVVWVHTHKQKYPFILGAYSSLYIPKKLLRSIILKGMPLLANEALWSVGMAFINQCYSLRSLDVVAASNISGTVFNLCSVVFLSMGNAVGIIIGQQLGAGSTAEEVQDTDRKLIFASVVSCLLFGSITFAVSGVFPLIYNTTPQVRQLATHFIMVSACLMPCNAYCHAAYFTLRSGGQTLVTFLFDSCFVWTVVIPLAFVLSHYTAIPIILLYAICQGSELLKVALGAYMIRKGTWINNLAQKN